MPVRGVLAACLLVAAGMSADAGQGRYLFDVVKAAPYRDSYERLVAPLRKTARWVVGAQGVGGASVNVNVDGRAFEVFSLCQPHDCHDNRLAVLFSADARQAYGAFRTPKGTTYLGKPDPVQQRALEGGFN
ncbi:Ivy family c-type lysozyme inhibitor [Ancylobacter terrae]|uniref:Ivy family c-type lysozyme inhibitor n=1 Tax=Ancylobacter sp. sgz301288 TaxID=3342077 RepID=UPI00385DB9A9